MIYKKNIYHDLSGFVPWKFNNVTYHVNSIKENNYVINPIDVQKSLDKPIVTYVKKILANHEKDTSIMW